MEGNSRQNGEAFRSSGHRDCIISMIASLQKRPRKKVSPRRKQPQDEDGPKTKMAQNENGPGSYICICYIVSLLT